MRKIHQSVVTFGTAAIVALVAIAGTTVQAANNDPMTKKKTTLIQKIQEGSKHAGGCSE